MKSPRFGSQSQFLNLQVIGPLPCSEDLIRQSSILSPFEGRSAIAEILASRLRRRAAFLSDAVPSPIRAGFTLVELLVVCSILALLSSLVLAALGGAKTRTQTIKCVNNVRQLGIGHALYVSDLGMLSLDDPGSFWPARLPLYVPYESGAYICPSTREQPEKRASLKLIPPYSGTADMPYNMQPTRSPRLVSSYGINGWLGRFPTGPRDKPLTFFTESAVMAPSTTPVFGDSLAVAPWPRTNSVPPRDLYADAHPGIDKIRDFAIGRHGSRATLKRSHPIEPGASMGPWRNNIFCFDGHVERARLNDLWSFTWSVGWVPPPAIPALGSSF